MHQQSFVASLRRINEGIAGFNMFKYVGIGHVIERDLVPPDTL
jgi:hypothetical protein